MDRVAWWATAHGIAKSRTRLGIGAHRHTHVGVQGGEQKQGALYSGKTGRTGLQMVRYSPELIL